MIHVGASSLVLVKMFGECRYEVLEDEGLWLHCVRYSGPEWSYECPYPEWASL